MSRGRSVPIGKPLSERTVDRYCNDLDGLYARRLRLAYVTGLRRGNLMSLRLSAVHLDAKTVSIAKTKNGSALIVPIPESVAAELRRLPRPAPDALVFEGGRGKPHGLRKLWEKVCREAGLPKRNFHQLRHGCASTLARSGCNQAQLMHALGHRSLRSSAQYMHFNVDDRRQVMERVISAREAGTSPNGCSDAHPKG
jgi:integrase